MNIVKIIVAMIAISFATTALGQTEATRLCAETARQAVKEVGIDRAYAGRFAGDCAEGLIAVGFGLKPDATRFCRTLVNDAQEDAGLKAVGVPDAIETCMIDIGDRLDATTPVFQPQSAPVYQQYPMPGYPGYAYPAQPTVIQTASSELSLPGWGQIGKILVLQQGCTIVQGMMQGYVARQAGYGYGFMMNPFGYGYGGC